MSFSTILLCKRRVRDGVKMEFEGGGEGKWEAGNDAPTLALLGQP